MIDSLYLDFGHDFVVAKDSLLVVQRDTTAGIGEHSVRDFGLWADSTAGGVSGRRAYFRRTGIVIQPFLQYSGFDLLEKR